MGGCVTFWHGAALGFIERACIRSLLRQGHDLAIYAYDAPEGLPTGVEVRDAAEILPRSRVFLHRSGSPGMFADGLRYELQRRALGTWVDLDLYFVAPLDFGRPYLFGLQEPGVINNAVLRIPADSPLLAALLRLFEGDTSPPWLSPRERLEVGLKRRLLRQSGAQPLPWGATGPRALSALAADLGLADRALPRETFYPAPWQDAAWIADPSRALDDVLTPSTVAVHLWNHCIGALKRATPPEGSFLARLAREGAPA